MCLFLLPHNYSIRNKMAKQEKTPMTRPMPKTSMGISKIGAAKKAVKVAKVVKAAKAIKKMC